MAYDRALAEQVREGLAPAQSVREVSMFGGLGFMLGEKLTVFVRPDGGLIFRCLPSRVEELEGKGAQIAEMGGRSPGPGWLQVSADQISTAQTLDFWLDVALEHSRSATKSTTT